MKLQRFISTHTSLKLALWLTIVAVTFHFTTFSVLAETTTAPGKSKIDPAKKNRGKLSPVLKRLNRQMHSTLRGAIQHRRVDLGPLIIFEQGKMKLLKQNKEVAAFPIMPPLEYQQLKVFGHILFATIIQLQRVDLNETDRVKWVKEISKDINLAIAELKMMKLSPELAQSQAGILRGTLSLLSEVEVSPPDHNRLKRYAKEYLPAIWLGGRRCAILHLKVIDEQAKKIWALLTQEERRNVRAHLYGGRGARVDNLVIQYLSWLFGSGTGKESDRIIFSENILDHDRALDMFAKYRMESDLAKLIFNDYGRLDRDLLGDVTREVIQGWPAASEIMNSIPTP